MMNVTLKMLGVAATLVAPTAALADALPWTPPADVVQVSPCVPKMDQHWANKKDLPLGPYFNVHDGKLIGIEYAVSQEDFKAGKNFPELPLTYEGKPVAFDHIDIGFQPKGHKGFEKPHYDFHIYLIPPRDVDAITCK